MPTCWAQVLGPLLDTAVTRLGFVLRRAFEVAAERAVAGGELDTQQVSDMKHCTLAVAVWHAHINDI
jgi:hypothetical protein